MAPRPKRTRPDLPRVAPGVQLQTVSQPDLEGAQARPRRSSRAKRSNPASTGLSEAGHETSEEETSEDAEPLPKRVRKKRRRSPNVGGSSGSKVDETEAGEGGGVEEGDWREDEEEDWREVEDDDLDQAYLDTYLRPAIQRDRAKERQRRKEKKGSSGAQGVDGQAKGKAQSVGRSTASINNLDDFPGFTVESDLTIMINGAKNPQAMHQFLHEVMTACATFTPDEEAQQARKARNDERFDLMQQAGLRFDYKLAEWRRVEPSGDPTFPLFQVRNYLPETDASAAPLSSSDSSAQTNRYDVSCGIDYSSGFNYLDINLLASGIPPKGTKVEAKEQFLIIDDAPDGASSAMYSAAKPLLLAELTAYITPSDGKRYLGFWEGGHAHGVFNNALEKALRGKTKLFAVERTVCEVSRTGIKTDKGEFEPGIGRYELDSGTALKAAMSSLLSKTRVRSPESLGLDSSPAASSSSAPLSSPSLSSTGNSPNDLATALSELFSLGETRPVRQLSLIAAPGERNSYLTREERVERLRKAALHWWKNAGKKKRDEHSAACSRARNDRSDAAKATHNANLSDSRQLTWINRHPDLEVAEEDPSLNERYEAEVADGQDELVAKLHMAAAKARTSRREEALEGVLAYEEDGATDLDTVTKWWRALGQSSAKTAASCMGVRSRVNKVSVNKAGTIAGVMRELATYRDERGL
ncbi:hypothetical protein Rhopal_006635-T1 [Rhodotorula paludigena]|uniref:Uncharacterized protein n=1 Tax=Rhodotorula paludigena TaxID=86838 RepID=A0AAV5GYJ5_9BASI|nr:hypothetical protein Rhopal_006635-T1 [Rhodotorula paludigena]